MSSSLEQDVPSILHLVFIGNCVLMIAIAFYAFDWCIRVGREVDLIWSRGYSLISALYGLLEVSTALYLGLSATQNLVYMDCKLTTVEPRVPEEIALQAITASYDAVIAVIATLRVRAINGGDWRLSAVVFLLFILRSAYQLFECINIRATDVPPPVGCVDGVASTAIEPCLCLDLS
ncbi:hypothetical protein EVJ58_g2006 [Rhodofomes roseus]|uniref:DUF6533 domain-containing protein n=1 Tax=Rhodofomes roseus TaxID=34475 RepID=A0A4Y9YSN0_9APHY|nr:hypothetical protein EVJ58_g2006 [Rhodofomes roseus]